MSVCLSACHTCVQWCQQSGQATNAMFSPTYFVHLQSLIYFIAYWIDSRICWYRERYLHFVRYLNFRIKARIHQSYISKWADIDEIIFYVWVRFSWKCCRKRTSRSIFRFLRFHHLWNILKSYWNVIITIILWSAILCTSIFIILLFWRSSLHDKIHSPSYLRDPNCFIKF